MQIIISHQVESQASRIAHISRFYIPSNFESKACSSRQGTRGSSRSPSIHDYEGTSFPRWSSQDGDGSL